MLIYEIPFFSKEHLTFFLHVQGNMYRFYYLITNIYIKTAKQQNGMMHLAK